MRLNVCEIPCVEALSKVKQMKIWGERRIKASVQLKLLPAAIKSKQQRKAISLTSIQSWTCTLARYTI